MNDAPWKWNEMQQIGTDYANVAEVEAYDRRMGEFRNVEAENAAILGKLDQPRGACVLEIGCGTGRFALAAARADLKVTAFDVSELMLQYVKSKAEEMNLATLHTQHGGFLTMQVPDCSFDAAVTSAALHHLPDAWKIVALANIARALKPSGQFILADVVFSAMENEEPASCMCRFAESVPTMAKQAARHVAVEFSTFDWIIEEMLKMSGFEILSDTQAVECFHIYHCRKKDVQ